MSATRIHSKISKVSPNPKKHHIFTHKVVAYPKIISKNILKVVTTCKIPNTIQSQICPYHKDTLLSATRKQNNKTVRTTRTHNKVIHILKHSKHNTFTQLSTLQYKVIHTITHSIQYYIIFLRSALLVQNQYAIPDSYSLIFFSYQQNKNSSY